MMFYRLALNKILKFLKIDELFAEDTPRKKQKEVYKKMLILDQQMNNYVSILLSLISVLINLTIPVVALEKPCQALKENKMDVMFVLGSWIENHLALIDTVVMALFVALVFVSTQMITDGIIETNISMSPWREQGKYQLPEDIM